MRIRTRTLPEGWKPEPTGLPVFLQRAFAARGVSPDEATDFSLSRLLDYRSLKGIGQAAVLLAEALCAGRHIVVVGDVDADGATSCALAVDTLSRMGAERVSFLVPNRFEHGYGLTPELVALAVERRAELLVTVDHGISSVEGVAAARAEGIPVLVTDHHLPGSCLPDAGAIVNPNQPGCAFPSKNLAGVGVIFYVLIALRAHLHESGWFADKGIARPELACGLDLVAIGTIADLVPMDANNRLLVQGGLQRIRAGRCRFGIRALAKASKVELGDITARDIGYRLAPSLNAAGRLEDIGRGVRCLLEKDMAVAENMAIELRELNARRRAMEARMNHQADSAVQKIASQTQTMLPGLCLFNESWHVGIIGILAARVRERWHRPVIAMAPDPASPGWLKGSARSIENLHIRDVLANIDAREPDLLPSFGGHAMAAGLSLRSRDFDRFHREFVREIAAMMDEDMLDPRIFIDGELTDGELNHQMARLCQTIVPWGKDFPAPVFGGNFRVGSSLVIKRRHLKWRVRPLRDSVVPWMDAFAFNTRVDEWKSQIKSVRLFYELGFEKYNGVLRLQLIVRHWDRVPDD